MEQRAGRQAQRCSVDFFFSIQKILFQTTEEQKYFIFKFTGYIMENKLTLTNVYHISQGDSYDAQNFNGIAVFLHNLLFVPPGTMAE